MIWRKSSLLVKAKTRSITSVPAIANVMLGFHDFLINSLANPNNEPFRKHKYSCQIAKNGLKNIPKIRRVIVVGSGGLSIGQAGEFDYSGMFNLTRITSY
jgi:hypothetical protein